MPTKRLPDSAHLDHLKRQAKDLLRDFRDEAMSAYQRVREFHPKFDGIADAEMQARSFALSDAQLSIAREYGYASWPRLKAVVAQREQVELELNHNERLPDGPFKQALDFMDAGDLARLTAHLQRYPDVIRERAQFEGGNYFQTPSLLEFLPENPNRLGRLAPNAIEVAEVLLKAGAAQDQTALDETLMLAASGRLCRESGVQDPLLRLLCAHGAQVDEAMHSALAHEEFDAARVLIDCGAPMGLATAAALDERGAVDRLVAHAAQDELQLALALAASAGRAKVVQVLLSHGADPNRYNPPGGHSHCTALHSAVANDRRDTVRVLLDGGADAMIGDIHHKATALDWAVYLKRESLAEVLKAHLGLS